MNYVLDTHVWIWWNMRPEALSSKVKAILDDVSGGCRLFLSVLSVWEFSKLLEKGRLKISCPGDAWIQEALKMPMLELVPLSPAIAYQSTILPKPVHDDPADQIIMATARDLGALLVTKDELMHGYPYIKTFW